MRETVERPEAVVDINALPYRDIELDRPAARRVAGADVRTGRPSRRAPEFPVIARRWSSAPRPAAQHGAPSAATYAAARCLFAT